MYNIYDKTFENLDNFQLNIEFLLTILGFQGRIFLNLHIMFFGSCSKKKLGFSQLLGGEGGQDQRCENSQLFFFE